jgi:hypothetical protein
MGEKAPPLVSCPLGCTWAQPCAYHQRRIEDAEDQREYPDPDLEYESQRDGREWL